MSEENTNEEIDFDGMSDEEFNNFQMPDITPEEENEILATEDAVVQEEKEESKPEDNTTEVAEEEKPTEEKIEEETTEVNPLEELLKTKLKVGDTEITVNSAEELVTLAQRGLGASKRIQELAPKLKTLSTLEANGITDPDDINFMIALHKKDPAAIKKLVAASGVEAFDVSTEVEEEYVAKDYSVSDGDYAIQEAFEAIVGTSSYDATLETIKAFDTTSKVEIQNDPSVISKLNNHHADGTYQQVRDVIVKERALGNLMGMNDLQAYKHVIKIVEEYQASIDGGQEAGHNNLNNDQSSGENLAGTEGTQEAGHDTNTGKQVGKAQEAARKAAESTNKNRGASNTTVESVNFDDLTDEEIMNLDIDGLFK